MAERDNQEQELLNDIQRRDEIKNLSKAYTRLKLAECAHDAMSAYRGAVQLLTALRKHVNHLDGCNEDHNECDCGLSTALAILDPVIASNKEMGNI